MKNLAVHKILIAIAFVLALAIGWATVGESVIHAATCVGATPCKACKNCSSCKYCAKDKGKCGTCRR